LTGRGQNGLWLYTVLPAAKYTGERSLPQAGQVNPPVQGVMRRQDLYPSSRSIGRP